MKSPLHLLQAIEERKRKGLFRELKFEHPATDFCSNDYLGFAKDGLLEAKISELNLISKQSGSTGSRLISGNSEFVEQLEREIASFHNAESALLFNSGYDANLGLMSAVPQKEDLILFDELIHASLYDGIRLSFARHYKFKHNDIVQLTELVERHKNNFKNIYIVVESVYSMDGDEAPLEELVNVGEKNNCHLIIDEAHAIGIFGKHGRGLCNELNIEGKCFARIYTYGKAMGCHGAAVAGSKALRDYLINFSRSFIYTTALPFHSLASIKAAYVLLKETDRIELLKRNISFFNQLTEKSKKIIKSRSAIHCKVIKGNDKVDDLEKKLAEGNFYVKAIKSPTVKEGKERIRICLHAFNSEIDIKKMTRLIK
jgi:8-amino-7-oxononanoate synthase